MEREIKVVIIIIKSVVIRQCTYIVPPKLSIWSIIIIKAAVQNSYRSKCVLVFDSQTPGDSDAVYQISTIWKIILSSFSILYLLSSPFFRLQPQFWKERSPWLPFLSSLSMPSMQSDHFANTQLQMPPRRLPVKFLMLGSLGGFQCWSKETRCNICSC